MTDYDYYLLGCRYSEVVPLSRWRFQVSYSHYLREQKQANQRLASLEERRRLRYSTRWYKLFYVAGMVERGRDLAARAGRFGEDENGSAGAGDREPRVPLTPVLTGCGARPLPRRDEFFVVRQL